MRERQHLAMAGSEHLHLPHNATAHCAAHPIYHVPRWANFAVHVVTKRLQAIYVPILIFIQIRAFQLTSLCARRTLLVSLASWKKSS